MKLTKQKISTLTAYKSFKALRAFIVVTALLFLTSCINETIFIPDEPTSEEVSKEAIYLSLNLSSGAGTLSRASTDYADSMDKENGQDYENTIKNVKLILADNDNKVLITFEAADDDDECSVKLKQGSSTEYRAIFKKDYNDIKDFLDKAENGKIKAQVFIVCNSPLSYNLPAENATVQQELKIDYLSDIINYGGAPTSVTVPGENGEEEKTTLYNHFLMTNGDYQTSTEDSQKNKYSVTIDVAELRKRTTKDNAYPLNNDQKDEEPYIIPVQRSLSRFDLGGQWSDYIYYFDKDGNPLGKGKDDSAQNAPEGAFVQVSVKYIGLANVNKNFNLFKETGTVFSETGKEGEKDKWGYFWSEAGKGEDNLSRFVFDPKYTGITGKRAILNDPDKRDTELAGFYLNHISEVDWIDDGYYTNIQDLLGNNDLKAGDVYGSDNSEKYTDDNYHLWTYCTPNTIHEKEMQKNGISTAVVFAARLNFLNGGLGEGTWSPTKEEERKYKETPIYAWGGKFYGTNMALQAAANAKGNAKDLAMSKAYEAAVSSVTGEVLWENNDTKTGFTDLQGVDRDVPDKDKMDKRFEAYNAYPTDRFSKALTENGFSIFVPVNLSKSAAFNAYEYGCLYYYWNRHNDNSLPETMGDMEFAVVRNNIYKLKLTDLTSIGHPIPVDGIETDPDPLDPWTDDELPRRYISIECKVVNWGIRKDEDITLY